MPRRARSSPNRAAAVDPARLLDIVAGFRGRPIALIGDLVADEFVYGDIMRISREAPVPILQHRRSVLVPGGAGNTVANLRALGGRPLPVGVVGRDEAGRRLVAELKDRGISVAGIVSQPDYATPSKSRILAGGVHTRRQQLVRIDRGSPEGELSREALTRIRAKLAQAMGRAGGLVVADYGYGAATPPRLSAELRRLARKGVPVVVDSRGRVSGYRMAAACTPNQEELELALGGARLDAGRPTIEAAGRRLRTMTGNRAVLVTRGAEGMCLIERSRKPVHIPAYGSDEVADVTGAGDTVVAAFTLAVVSGATFAEAARLANYAAGLVVMKAGTATLTPEELTRAIREDSTQT